MPTTVEHRTKREGTLSGCQKTTTTSVTSSPAALRRSAILGGNELRQCRTGSYGRGRMPRRCGVCDIEQHETTGSTGPSREHEPTTTAGHGPEPCTRSVAV